jgi:hypothetical protein
MPGQTVATHFSSARNINAPVGGQWQASTSGVPVPRLPHGTVPTAGYTALGIQQTSQKPALQPNTFPGPVSPSTGAPSLRAPTAKPAPIGAAISRSVNTIGNFAASAVKVRPRA